MNTEERLDAIEKQLADLLALLAYLRSMNVYPPSKYHDPFTRAEPDELEPYRPGL